MKLQLFTRSPLIGQGVSQEVLLRQEIMRLVIDVTSFALMLWGSCLPFLFQKDSDDDDTYQSSACSLMLYG